MVSNLFNHVFTIFEILGELAETLGFVRIIVILFLWFKLMMLVLFVAIFVVVMLEIIVVIFWPQERPWLCVECVVAEWRDDDNVMLCVVHVVLDVGIVVICVCCDGMTHGEVLVILVNVGRLP